MHMNNGRSEVPVTRKIVSLLAAASCVISALALVGWVTGRLYLASFGERYIPMAPSTAVSFLLLNTVLLVMASFPLLRLTDRLKTIAGIILIAVGGLILARLPYPSIFDPEHLLIPPWGRNLVLNGVPLGRMSPITALGMMLSGAVLLFMVRRDTRMRDGAGVMAVLVLSLGLILFLTYIHDTPLLYGAGITPVALTTALAFILSGAGLIAALGAGAFPLRHFLGTSVRARLIRYFIPVLLLAILLDIWQDRFIIENRDAPGFYAALSTIGIMLLIYIVVLKVAGSLGADIDDYLEAIRSSEERYRNIFNSTLDGIYEVNAEGIFTHMNPAGARIFGYSSSEEIIGRKALKFWRDPRDREAFRTELKLKKTVSAYYMAARKKNGEPLELESSSRIIEDGEGNFLGIEGILRDVTERKRFEAEREKFILKLREALAEVRTLSGMLPICSSCKKIRDDKGYWSQIESYISKRSGAEFSHGICPECEKKAYAELGKLTKERLPADERKPDR
jgi:PAS domain S-box-containing protein